MRRPTDTAAPYRWPPGRMYHAAYTPSARSSSGLNSRFAVGNPRVRPRSSPWATRPATVGSWAEPASTIRTAMASTSIATPYQTDGWLTSERRLSQGWAVPSFGDAVAPQAEQVDGVAPKPLVRLALVEARLVAHPCGDVGRVAER